MWGNRFYGKRFFGDRYWGQGGLVIAATPARTLVRLEIWSTWQCAGGTRQAVIPMSQVAALTTIERIQHDDEGQLVLSKESAAAAYVADGSVLRLLFTDGHFTEWVMWIVDDSSKESRVLRVTLRSVLTTLDDGEEVLSETTATVATVDLEWKALTPTTIANQILTFAPSWWTIGTIAPTIPVDLAPSGWFPLRAFRELVAAIRAQAVPCELHFRRNATSGYIVDILTTIGSSENVLDVRTRKNLLGMSRRRDREKYAVEVVPLGTGTPRPTIARAWWECTAKATNVLTFQQPVTGGDMVGFDDQLNGLYMVDDTGARQQISDSVASSQEVTVASGTNFTAGRWYRLVVDSTGNDMVRLRKAPATTGRIRPVESSALDGATNIQSNPAMRVWTGASSAPPDGWTSTEGTLTRTTTSGLWKYGGQSCRVQGSAFVAGNIESAPISIYVPAWAQSVTFSAWFRRIGGVGTVVQGRRDGSNFGSSTTVSTVSDTFDRTDITVATPGTGAVRNFSVLLAFTGANAANDMYVDAAMVTLNPSATGSTAAFVEGSNPAKLWALGNQYLATYSTTPTSYGATFADLNQWDATGFPYDIVALGQTANVRDTDLGVTTAGRIIELRRDWKNPLASHLTIATRPEDFVSLLTGIAA